MAKVDGGDDSIRRFVVYHYRFDPERPERRHVLVAAFDKKREFEACMASIRTDIERRATAGEPVDRHEHSLGRIYEPGHLRRAATGHLVRRMMEHGVDLSRWLKEQDLPHNMALFASGRSEMPAPGLTARLGRLIHRWLRGTGRP